ncbi:hypothetical protein [Halorussus salinisoli]|uniref:hypothetical protein n=1 Tax=Halorussus salinisoli TaxID=2558242 RepID=UPI0010C17C85|nr:hypothetical protein [Halorussus salinisoli]
MKRREMLARFGAVLGTASLGGCLGRYEDVVGGEGESTTAEPTTDGGLSTDGEQPTDEHTTDERTTDTERTTTRVPQSTLVDSSFELTGSGCGESKSEASVRFRDEERTVVVAGTIPGSNACYVAELADASYDPETGTLAVTVASVQKKGADACAQCITEIGYEATLSFEGDLPATVEVVHEAMGESKTVTSAESR